MAALAVVPERPMTLYAIEEQLADLTAQLENATTPEEQAAIEAQLAGCLDARDGKIDRTGRFLAHMEAQAELAKAEAQRLVDRRHYFERAIQRLEAYIVRHIEAMGFDPRGNRRKLEGETVTFALRACPCALKIDESREVPDEFKIVTLAMPAGAFAALLKFVGPERASALERCVTETVIDNAALKNALRANIEVPGARLLGGKNSLRRS